MNLKYYLTVITFICLCNFSFSQNLRELIAYHLLEKAKDYNLSKEDLKEWGITSQHVSSTSDVKHIYGIQKYRGIEIYKALFSLHLSKEGNVIAYNNTFIPDLISKTNDISIKPKISSNAALLSASRQLNIDVSSNKTQILKAPDGIALEQILESKQISSSPIHMKLMYFLNSENQLVLVWDMSIDEITNPNWWSLKVDASTGEILNKVNWTKSSNPMNQSSNPINQSSKKKSIIKNEEKVYFTNNIQSSSSSSYLVYAIPVESPNFGFRSSVVNPDDSQASPFGWHDTNGAPGAEYTITRGNNVYAYDDNDANNIPGYSPNGGSSLYFNYPINTTYTNLNQSEDAAITNLFYWNNIIHDVFYRYGFDESSGNFQENNYGKGGTNASPFPDSVLAEAQDGFFSNNNAGGFFSTPPDGQKPRMEIYIFQTRDGDYDNGVIIHEYGHGITNRLVGGAGNTNVLTNSEQMGEGYSDWFALMMTIEPNDSGTNLRTVGTWALGEAANGDGARHHPYSTDIAISPYTYNDIATIPPGQTAQHHTGAVWASMLWEMTWGLIDAYGYNSNFYGSTGGNNKAMKLVIESLKLLPTSPGFVDARDAILDADIALNGGQNHCIIWEAFAKRGLGENAVQGLTTSRTDGTEDFDTPVCSIVDPCESVTGAFISETVNPFTQENDYSLCWDDISNGRYTIEFKASNDCANGDNGSLTPSATYLQRSNCISLLRVVKDLDRKCFRWRIKTDCGTWSDWCLIGAGSNGQEGFEIYENCVSNLNRASNLLSIHPVPSIKTITVNHSSLEIISYEVYNVFGRMIKKSKNINANSTSFNIEHLDKGFYVIKVRLNDNSFTTKNFIKN